MNQSINHIRKQIAKNQEKAAVKNPEGKSGLDAYIVDNDDSDGSSDSFEDAQDLDKSMSVAGQVAINPRQLIDLELIN